MNKVLFVHDTKFKESIDGQLFTGGSYNERVWNRYRSLGSDITVVARLEVKKYSEIEANKMFNLFPNDLNFIKIPDITTSISSRHRRMREGKKIITAACEFADILVARLPGWAGTVAIDVFEKLSKPYLVEIVGCPWDSLWNHSIRGKLFALPGYMRLKKYAKQAPWVIYVTNQFLQTRYPTKGKYVNCSNVILNEVDAQYLEQRKDRIKQLSMKERPILNIATVAAVDVKYKGQQHVIKALSRVDNKDFNFHYHIIGGGNPRTLQRIVQKFNLQKKVLFTGSLPHNAVMEYLKTIDIYIEAVSE